MTWTARRAPLRPGRARCTGTASANRVTPLGGLAVERDDVAGPQREHVLDAHVRVGDLGAHGDLDAAQGGVDGLAVDLLGPAGAGAVALREGGGDRRDGQEGDEQRERRGDAADARLDASATGSAR